MTTKARKKKAQIWNVRNFFYVGLPKLKHNQIFLNKISHNFKLTAKLFTGQKSLVG
jgi:hypothetical protein